MKKIILLIIIFFSSQGVHAGYDEEYNVNLWNLGDLRQYSPLNFYDFTVIEDNSEVKITYTGYDCDNDADFFVYINGFQNINCTGGNSNAPGVDSMSFTMQSGTYELYFDYNINNSFRISDVIIQIEYPQIQVMDQDIYVTNSNSFFSDINDFIDDKGFYDLIIIEIGLYLFALLSITFFKIMKLTNERFNKGFYY